MAEKEENYVTRVELLESKNKLRKELNRSIDDVNKKVTVLNDIVLPLAESSKQTAINTDRMANSMDEFTREQRKTNGDFYDKLHEHDNTISNLGLRTELRVEDKKEIVKIIVAGIGLVGIIIGGIFGLAPYLFT